MGSLAVAEERLRELQTREIESKRQQQCLLQRQWDLGGSEIRLSGLEGALARQQTRGNSVETTAAREQNLSNADVAEMQKRLTRLRRDDIDWVERTRLQQCEVQRLEALAGRLKSSQPQAPERRYNRKVIF